MSFVAACNSCFGASGYLYVNARTDGAIIPGPYLPLTYTQTQAAFQQMLMMMGLGS